MAPVLDPLTERFFVVRQKVSFDRDTTEKIIESRSIECTWLDNVLQLIQTGCSCHIAKTRNKVDE